MYYARKVCLSCMVLCIIWQLMLHGTESLKIHLEKRDIESRIISYLDALKQNSAWKKFWRMITFRKKIKTNNICKLTSNQLLTLCKWITESPEYNKTFKPIKPNNIQEYCLLRPFKLSIETIIRHLNMFTCPPSEEYPAKKHLEGTSFQPGTLFLSGSLALDSAVVFTQTEEKIPLELVPYGYVNDIDMETLKKVKEFKFHEDAGAADRLNSNPS